MAALATSQQDSRPGLRPGEVVELQTAPSDPPVAFPVSARGEEEVDLNVLLLDRSGRTRTDQDFVLYNAPVSPKGAVRLAAPTIADGERRQTVTIDLTSLVSEGVERLAVIISSQIPLAAVPALRVDLTSATLPGLVLPIPAEPGVAAAVITEVYLRSDADGSQWRLRGLGQGWVEGLAGVAREYGVHVDD